MKSTIVNFIEIVCLIALLSACKSTRVEVKKSMPSLPEAYTVKKDSSSIEINWRKFFDDENLIALVDTALKNNLDVLIAFQKIEAVKSNVLLAKGMLKPTVSGGVSAAQRRYGLYTMDGAGNISTEITPGRIVPVDLPDYFVGLQTQWEADIWGKLRSKKQAALARYLASVEGRNLVVTSLIAEVSGTYFELLSLDIELEIINEAIELQQNALAIASAQKQAAFSNELAVKQFEAQVLSAQILALETTQKIIQNENKINFLLGRYPQAITRNQSDFYREVPEDIKTGIPSDLLQNRPDIRQAEQALLASKFDVKFARASFYPSFNITGLLGFQAFETKLLFNTPESITYALVGSIMAPLLNRAAIKAQFNNAKAQQIDAIYTYQRTILNGYIEVSTELSNIENLAKIAALVDNKVAVVAQSNEISNDLFKAGKASYLEVLMTQRLMLETRIEFVKTRKLQNFATINIYKALGGGWR